MAIIHVLSVEIEPFKDAEAIAWTKDMNAHLESVGLGPARTLRPQFGGDTNRIVWTWEHDSLAAQEQHMLKLNADEGAQTRIKALAGIIVGVLIGLALDSWLGTRPWLMLLFFVLGAAAGITSVMRTARRIEDDAAAKRKPQASDKDRDG